MASLAGDKVVRSPTSERLLYSYSSTGCRVGFKSGLGVKSLFPEREKEYICTGINDLPSTDRGQVVAEKTGMNGGNNGRNRGEAGILVLLYSDS